MDPWKINANYVEIMIHQGIHDFFVLLLGISHK